MSTGDSTASTFNVEPDIAASVSRQHTWNRLTDPMHQSAVVSITVKDNQNYDPATTMPGAMPKTSDQGKEESTKAWMADIEPLSIVINFAGGCFVGSLIDRRLQCTIELPVEPELQSAQASALKYAEEYMHLHLKDACWVLPPSVEWSEFVAIRSPEELQQRITTQSPTIALPSLAGIAANRQSSRKSAPSTARPFVVKRPEASPAPLFLSISEAGRYSGLSVPFLKRKIDSGELRAIKDRGWKVRKADLRKI
jgi:excisionase family DNA binding protein